VASILATILKCGAVLWLWQADFFQTSMFVVSSTKFRAAAADGEA
jgi:hypothetical protein